MKLARALPVFSIAFVVLYVVAMDNNWALVTYLPRSREWLPLVVEPVDIRKTGPGMYWYGWLATAGLGAAAAAVLWALLPRHWTRDIGARAVWLVGVAAILVVAYILRGWFIHLA